MLQEAGQKKYLYTYKYDSHGWIERTTSQVVKRGKDAFTTPIDITYRTLTYY
jgi:hypothetical protein